jgi:NAD(P)H-nitrite reductase large subunit
MNMKESGLIVVGSGPAGVSAAEAFRRHHHSLPITIMTADRHPPYQRPPLSKGYLRGDTDDVDLHPDQWYRDHNIDIDYVSAVTDLDADAHTVTANGIAYPYQSLVLACGARPRPLPVAGGEHAYSLRSLHDAQQLRDDSAAARSAVVIGAGFIGCEAAGSLATKGIAVILVSPEAVPQAKRLGERAGHRLLALLEDSGVRYRGAVNVRAITANTVHLADDSALHADLILAATGATPNSGLAQTAGIAVQSSRLVAGADMATSVPDVYAAGDVALARNATAGRALVIEHWQDAADQGEIAGVSAAGRRAEWSVVPGFWSTIGETTIKYHGWGDGFDRCRMLHRDSGFTVWYEKEGTAVGVLTCNADEDYELGEQLITARQPAPIKMSKISAHARPVTM